MLAAACRPSSEAGVGYAMEAVEAQRSRRDLERATHEQVLTQLLMVVFSRLRELEREAEAIPFKTEAARLNPDVVESVDPPAAPASADYNHKGLLGNTMEYEPESEDAGRRYLIHGIRDRSVVILFQELLKTDHGARYLLLIKI